MGRIDVSRSIGCGEPEMRKILSKVNNLSAEDRLKYIKQIKKETIKSFDFYYAESEKTKVKRR